jgi:quercetin dioxygenase-like cupin family protein
MDKPVIHTKFKDLGPLLKVVENYPAGRKNTTLLGHPEAENMLIVYQVFEPGHMGRYHTHKRSENVFFVLQGTMEALIGGKRYYVKAGEMIYCPNNIPHTMGCYGEETVIGLEIYAPSRGEHGEMDSFPAEEPAEFEDANSPDD